ncbi:MAG: hypothetical protein SNJ63_09215, partial [Sphingomonadaceae bacterium]
LRQANAVGSPGLCFMILPMICWLEKTAFLILLLLRLGQTLFHLEYKSAGNTRNFASCARIDKDRSIPDPVDTPIMPK